MFCGVLGPLEVRDDEGAPIGVAGAKERQLLAVLATACPAVVSVDRLLDSVWDGDPPPTARKSLQAHVVRLRSALEPGRLRGSPGRYVVRRQAGYALATDRSELDSLAFADLSARGRALLSSGDAASAHAALTDALGLWRGQPYADWPDVPFARAERLRLEDVWVTVTGGLLEAELALGRHHEAIPQLEQMVRDQPLHEDWWSMLVLALYRSGRQGDALAAVGRARVILADELGIDPGTRLRGIEQAVLHQDTDLDLPALRPEPLRAPVAMVHGTGTCPYKGLLAYEPEDAAVFHGRDGLVLRFVASLVDNPLLVVAGSSGAGKSSVIRAGLLPALSGGALPGGHEWPHVVVTPGAHPVDALAALTGEEAVPAPVVLVCDQLEQLWSAGTDRVEREAFLDSVLGLLADGVVARCIVVIRGDHVGRLAEHPAMAEQIVGALELVPPLTETQLREVLERPAADVDLRVEPELVDVVVQDVVGRGGALPLLSMAMVGTWERRRGDLLTLGGYLAAGGVAGAVARTAEDVYASFDSEARQVARQVLVRLADHDDRGALKRRRMPMDEVDLSGPDSGTRRSVVEALVRHRLLTMDSSVLEVAHEALLSAWPRLARWLDDDAVGRAVRRHLAPAAQEWERHARPDDELYRGARLDAAVQWATVSASDVTAVERSFLDAGVAAVQAELSAAHRRADAEAAARTRTRRLAVGLATALALALVAAGVAVGFQRTARDRATDAQTAGKVADANRLAALSTTARSLDLSLLLAAAGMRTASTPATEDGLLTALVSHRRATGVFSVGDNVYETALAPDGRTLFTTHAGGEPTVTSWRTGSTAPASTVDSGWPDHIVASPDGRLVVTSHDRTRSESDTEDIVAFSRGGTPIGALRGLPLDGLTQDLVFTREGHLLAVVVNQKDKGRTPWRAYLTEVDLRRGTHGPLTFVSRSAGPQVALESSFAEDGSSLVVWAVDGSRATRVDLDTGTARPMALARRDAVSLGFVALRDGAVQRWSDGALTRYDRVGRAAQVLSLHEAPVHDVAVVPGGRKAVTVGEGGEVELWHISPTTGDWASRESLVGHVGNVEQAEVTRNGRTLLTISEDGVLISWDLTGSAGFGTTFRGMGDRWISSRIEVVNPGKLVVAAARGVRRTRSVAAVFLDPRTGQIIDRVAVGDTLPGLVFGSSVAVSPGARMVAVTSGSATTVLDTRTRDVIARIVLPETAPAPAEPSIPVWSASWTPDGRRLLLGSAGSETETSWHMVTVDTATWRPVGRVELPGGAAQVMQWSPDRTRLVIGLTDTPAVAVLDARLRVLRTVDLPDGGEPFDLAFSPDGDRLAVGGHNGRVSVVDTSTWTPVHDPARVHSGPVVDVEWLPDGNTVVTGGVDDVASMYDVERDLVRAASLPASDDAGPGYAFLMPGPTDQIVVLDGQTPGHRYPLAPSTWLAAACAIAGRDLTHVEWRRYVPTDAYRATCSDLLPS